MKKYNIAIVGATGLVGRKFLEIIDEYQINVGELRLFASKRSVGKEVVFQGNSYYIEELKEDCFVGIDFALFAASGSLSLEYAKQAINEGAIVIDNSSAWRMNDDVPLVVPEVNLNDVKGKKLIANPNCTTIQCVVPLAILDKKYQIETIEYNTYQAVSGAGKKGLDDLEKEFSASESYFPYDIKATCIPQIDAFLDDGYTKEEHKMINETRKILHSKNIKISATCIRVPVKNSHGVSIRVVFKQDYDINLLREELSASKGIVVVDKPEKYLYPVSTIANDNDNIYIGRIRRDKVNNKGLLLYLVSDNVRKGAAANAVQIMKGIIENYDIS